MVMDGSADLESIIITAMEIARLAVCVWLCNACAAKTAGSAHAILNPSGSNLETLLMGQTGLLNSASSNATNPSQLCIVVS